MRKLTAEEVLIILIELLLDYLEELKDFKNDVDTQFQYGERTAYTECLEYVEFWEKASAYGLTFDIEKKYPL